MQTLTEIHAACAEVVSAMIEKGFVTPNCHFYVTGNSTTCSVDLWVHTKEGPRLEAGCSMDYLSQFTADTPEEAFAAARKRVADQPAPEIAALHKYMRDLGGVVDQGRANGIPDEYTEPVSLTVKAMSENLLTVEASS